MIKTEFKKYQKKWEEANQEHRKEYLKNYCKINKEKINARSKKHYQEHKEEYQENHKEYYETHKEEHSKKAKEYYLKNKNKIKVQHRDYYQNNKDKIVKQRNQRLKVDFKFRIRKNLNRRLHHALKGEIKSISVTKLIGCSLKFLKNHLEFQFKSGMSWSNYGKWHVDHIRPCAKFDLSKSEEQCKCFHYTNLQPLWARDNLSKNKY